MPCCCPSLDYALSSDHHLLFALWSATSDVTRLAVFAVENFLSATRLG